ncbi:MAG: hypothetical protein ACRDMJ_14980 [Solirubrobacteraceae bacterium]
MPGAKVTLARRPGRRGRFTQVPNHSAIMSPANRRNPDRTDALGHFGWDVLPGFYQVTATRSGCAAVHGRGRAVRTKTLRVPPPVADLRLTMRCPRLRRAATRLRVLVARSPSGGVAVLARVQARRSHPVGYVIFRAGRRVLGEAALSSRTATASVILERAVRAGSIVAVYSGDGYDRPSRSRGVNAPRSARHRGADR